MEDLQIIVEGCPMNDNELSDTANVEGKGDERRLSRRKFFSGLFVIFVIILGIVLCVMMFFVKKDYLVWSMKKYDLEQEISRMQENAAKQIIDIEESIKR
jgi:hypothetical protein